MIYPCMDISEYCILLARTRQVRQSGSDNIVQEYINKSGDRLIPSGSINVFALK